MTLFSIFAGLGLLLAATGLYSVVSYAVAQRTQEFGIRMALGARPRHVLQLVAGSVTALIAAGTLAGSCGNRCP
jgi:ABC-type antimicrobial peptide transport system permease subunit